MPEKRLYRMVALSLFVLGMGLAACDESEQGRVLLYDKGTYLGKKDPALSQQTEDELRSRATLQAGT